MKSKFVLIPLLFGVLFSSISSLLFGGEIAVAHSVAGQSIRASEDGRGAVLTSQIQGLVGHLGEDGLWISSMGAEVSADRFQIRAESIGRQTGGRTLLAGVGQVELKEGSARWVREGLVEEYFVSADGIRQDFVVLERPEGEGNLAVGLAIEGAVVDVREEALALVTSRLNRDLTFRNLRVFDARGETLESAFIYDAEGRVSLSVVDEGAFYPVRIDPTYSDVSWVDLVPTKEAGYSIVETDGAGKAYFLGGNFARWDGAAFEVLGDGYIFKGLGGFFTSLEIDSSGRIYGATASAIYEWNGVEWEPFGSIGLTPLSINCIAKNSDGDFYAGVNVSSGGGYVGDSLLKWDGSSWKGFGDFVGFANGIECIEFDSSGKMYVGGQFESVDGIPSSNIACWDGESWSALNGFVGFRVLYMGVSADGVVYASSGGSDLQMWKEGEWSVIGVDGTGGEDFAVTDSGNVYRILNESGPTRSRVYEWNGAEWNVVGDAVGSAFGTRVASRTNGQVYTDEGFWNGEDWKFWDTTIRGVGSVYSLSGALDGRVYALFSRGAIVDGVQFNGLAAWDGNSWAIADDGTFGISNNGSSNLRGHISVAENGDIYGAGGFLEEEEEVFPYVKIWDGNRWDTIASTFETAGSTPLFFQSTTIDSHGNFYVGGTFKAIDGIACDGIAMWNGTDWVGLKNEFLGGVETIVAGASGELLVGGSFSENGVSESRVSVWNGDEWTFLGGGFSISVNAIMVGKDGSYYVGTRHSSGKGGVLRWDGSEWRSIGSPFEDEDLVSKLLEGKYGELYAVVNGVDTSDGSRYWTTKILMYDGRDWVEIKKWYDRGYGLYIDDDYRLYFSGRFVEERGISLSQHFAFTEAPLLVRPSGREIWQSEREYSLQWFGEMGDVKIEYSLDSGENWIVVEESVSREDGVYSWSVPSVSSSSARFRVTELGGEGRTKASEDFEIVSLELLGLNEGRVLQEGVPYPLEWDSSENLEAVDLHYSTDGGESWGLIEEHVDASVETYEWMPDVSTSSLLLRVSGSGDYGEIESISTGELEVRSLDLAAPTSGSTLIANSEFTFEWSSDLVDLVNLEYSRLDSGVWKEVERGVSASEGMYTWKVPYDISSDLVFRISDVEADSVFREVPISIVLPSRFVRFVEDAFIVEAPSYLNTLFHALDADGVGIEDLNVAELRITENGVEVSESERIVRMVKADQLEYTLQTVLMLDNSTTISVDEKPKVIEAARTFVESKLPGQEVAVYAFSGSTVLLQDFTTDKAALLAAIDSLADYPRISSTNLWGALKEGLGRWEDVYSLTHVTQGNLVVLTDGDHNSSPESIQTVLDARGTKRIITVSFGDESVIKQSVLNQLGNGGTYKGANVGELEGLFAQIQEDLIKFTNSFYWLGYGSPKQGDFENTFEVGAIKNTNFGADSKILETFNSRDFSPVVPAILVNAEPLKPYGVSSLTMPALGSQRVRIETPFTFGVLPYTFAISSPSSLEIESTGTLYEYDFKATGYDGQAVSVEIYDPVNEYTKTISVNLVDDSAFSAWASGLGLTGSAAAPDATPFGDAIPNLVRYAMGLGAEMVEGLPSSRLLTTDEGTVLEYRFSRSRTAEEVRLFVEYSEALQAWIVVPEDEWTSLEDYSEGVSLYELRLPVEDGGTPVFVRLRAESEAGVGD